MMHKLLLVMINRYVKNLSKIDKGPENDYELRGAVGADSDKSTREEAEEIHRPLEMEKGAENDLEVNGSVATNGVALSQSDGLLINQIGTVGTDSNKSPVEEITEMLKLLKVEEGSRENLQVNISANDVVLSQSDDLLTAVSSSSTLVDDRSSGSLNNSELRGVARVDSDISSGEETKQIPMVLEMEESAEKDLGVNGSGASNSVTLSQVNDLLINQVGAAGTEADTSIGEDIEETSAGNDYELEESAEKDLDVIGSGAAISVTLSQVSDLLINKVGAVGTESDTSIGEDINEANAGKDYEVNISVAPNDIAISHSDAIVINHIGAAGIEFNKTTDAVIEEVPEVLAMEESSGSDLETNISVSNNDVSQSDDLFITVSSSSTMSEDQSSGYFFTIYIYILFIERY
nr:hypothetical protein [Tanacetum cinerariifolium]